MDSGEKLYVKCSKPIILKILTSQNEALSYLYFSFNGECAVLGRAVNGGRTIGFRFEATLTADVKPEKCDAA